MIGLNARCGLPRTVAWEAKLLLLPILAASEAKPIGLAKDVWEAVVAHT